LGTGFLLKKSGALVRTGALLFLLVFLKGVAKKGWFLDAFFVVKTW
jgi:hypothetical protein